MKTMEVRVLVAIEQAAPHLQLDLVALGKHLAARIKEILKDELTVEGCKQPLITTESKGVYSA